METGLTGARKVNQSTNVSGTRPKIGPVNSNKMKKKRVRTPEKKEDLSDNESDDPSQKSVVFQRNIPKLKRVKDKN